MYMYVRQSENVYSKFQIQAELQTCKIKSSKLSSLIDARPRILNLWLGIYSFTPERLRWSGMFQRRGFGCDWSRWNRRTRTWRCAWLTPSLETPGKTQRSRSCVDACRHLRNRTRHFSIPMPRTSKNDVASSERCGTRTCADVLWSPLCCTSHCVYWQNVAQRICKLLVKALIDCFVLWIELTGKNWRTRWFW